MSVPRGKVCPLFKIILANNASLRLSPDGLGFGLKIRGGGLTSSRGPPGPLDPLLKQDFAKMAALRRAVRLRECPLR